MRPGACARAAVAVLVTSSPFVTSAQVVSGEGACAALRQVHVPGVVLSDVEARWLPAGSPPPPEPPWVPPLTVPLPAFCRLSATIDPRSGADGKSYGIGFALALPAEWNGRRH
jgi:feruloyl esterase